MIQELVPGVPAPQCHTTRYGGRAHMPKTKLRRGMGSVTCHRPFVTRTFREGVTEVIEGTGGLGAQSFKVGMEQVGGGEDAVSKA